MYILIHLVYLCVFINARFILFNIFVLENNINFYFYLYITVFPTTILLRGMYCNNNNNMNFASSHMKYRKKKYSESFKPSKTESGKDGKLVKNDMEMFPVKNEDSIRGDQVCVVLSIQYVGVYYNSAYYKVQHCKTSKTKSSTL